VNQIGFNSKDKGILRYVLQELFIKIDGKDGTYFQNSPVLLLIVRVKIVSSFRRSKILEFFLFIFICCKIAHDLQKNIGVM
jgi:hypothetical protein